jgi:diguanylate cyclase (GGDEF)-like protein
VVLTDAGNEVGVVTAAALLRSLAADEDPVTGLPRSGALRDWLAEKLEEGREVAVLFFDLDGFSEINKAYGHTEGDAFLSRAASAIRASCADSDFPARFGGDEFVIGTLRSRAEAGMLAQDVKEALVQTGLSSPAGIAGGRRSERRVGDNVAANVEELLRLASLDCMAQKERT